MRKAYIAGDNIISSLGFSSAENISNILENRIGLEMRAGQQFTPIPVPLSLVNADILDQKFTDLIREKDKLAGVSDFTKLEKMFMVSINDAMKGIRMDPANKRSLLIISTTKGNIDLLEEEKKEMFSSKRVYLWDMAEVIRQFFGFACQPVIVSSACISGVLGIGAGFRYIRSGKYDHVVVSGGDILSQFVISGFQSFQSLSPEPCKPYDISRNGLSLGEACGTMVMTSEPVEISGTKVIVKGTATSNDANHISGPSRTGEELALTVKKSMEEADLSAADIGYISAHGTATPFNDEMESKAFALSGLSEVPLNSYKGYWGHTLGAAGLIETVAALQSLRSGILYKTAGYSEYGVPEKITVIEHHTENPFDHFIKTASGFGGCNASVIIGKES